MTREHPFHGAPPLRRRLRAAPGKASRVPRARRESAGRRPPAAGYEVCWNQADASATGEPEPIGGPRLNAVPRRGRPGIRPDKASFIQIQGGTTCHWD